MECRQGSSGPCAHQLFHLNSHCCFPQTASASIYPFSYSYEEFSRYAALTGVGGGQRKQLFSSPSLFKFTFLCAPPMQHTMGRVEAQRLAWFIVFASSTFPLLFGCAVSAVRASATAGKDSCCCFAVLTLICTLTASPPHTAAELGLSGHDHLMAMPCHLL